MRCMINGLSSGFFCCLIFDLTNVLSWYCIFNFCQQGRHLSPPLILEMPCKQRCCYCCDFSTCIIPCDVCPPADLNHVRFSAYRTAMKTRRLQKALCCKWCLPAMLFEANKTTCNTIDMCNHVQSALRCRGGFGHDKAYAATVHRRRYSLCTKIQ